MFVDEVRVINNMPFKTSLRSVGSAVGAVKPTQYAHYCCADQFSEKSHTPALKPGFKM